MELSLPHNFYTSDSDEVKNDIIHQKTSKEDSFLNELGQQGWELTSIIHTDMKFEEKYRKTMYFKRIIK